MAKVRVRPLFDEVFSWMSLTWSGTFVFGISPQSVKTECRLLVNMQVIKGAGASVLMQRDHVTF
jgi:hypothetical protein